MRSHASLVSVSNVVRFAITLIVAATTWSGAISCAGNGTDRAAMGTTAGPISDYNSLVSHLREAGLRVEPAGEIQQPFFTPKAHVLRINSEEAQVYEFAGEQQAASEAARVAANGSIGGSMPMWIAPPHFFRKGRLIVIYLGSDDSTLLKIRGLLGSEFAGNR